MMTPSLLSHSAPAGFASPRPTESTQIKSVPENGTSSAASPSTSKPDAQELWRFIPLHDFDAPPEPPGETVRSTLISLWERLNERARNSENEEAEHEELQSVPPGLLGWIAPEPNWQEQCTAAIDDALEHWLQTEDEEAGQKMLVAAPHSNVADMAIQWSRAHEYAVIKPPTPTQILENDPQWMEQWTHNKASRLVFPWLERCYLRHHNGLDLARRLLDWLWATKKPCLLVSDSWAWCYLSRIYPLDVITPHPLTLAPLKAQLLNYWFAALARRDQRDHFIFRQEDNGEAIVRSQEKETTESPHSYLRHLAARSRGIPGVAWAIWRHSLQINDEHAIKEQVREKAAVDQGVTIWITPWDKLNLPDVNNKVSGDESFVLHSLLLHNGLPEELIPQLLPLSPARTLQALRHLQFLGLVERGRHGWQVAPLAYPSVRSHLRTEGYLTDEL